MTRYLLDTNMISDLMRNPQGAVAARIAQVGDRAVCTSVIVAAELRFGVAKKGSDRLASRLERILSAIEVQPFDAPADVTYANLRVRLEAAGTPIGGADMLIAAHALATECTVVTDNEREFSRVDDLRVENWMR